MPTTARTTRTANGTNTIRGSGVTYSTSTPARRGPVASPPTLATVAAIWARRVGAEPATLSRSVRYAEDAAMAAPRATPVTTRPTNRAGSELDQANTRVATSAISDAGMR